MTDALPTPAWAIAKADQRIAEMSEALGGMEMVGLLGANVVMTPMTEPPENASPQRVEMWERECDNCGRYCAGQFYSGVVQRKMGEVQVIIGYGSCPECIGRG